MYSQNPTGYNIHLHPVSAEVHGAARATEGRSGGLGGVGHGLSIRGRLGWGHIHIIFQGLSVNLGR